MKVAIIGANGFVGTRLLEMLVLGDSGHEPVPIVRRPSSLAAVCRFEVPWRIADALKPEPLAEALRGCDAVVHVAIGDPRQIERMPEVLGEAAAKAGVKRVVYMSSASVHGQAPEAGSDENTPLHTRHSLEYNNAKVRAEKAFAATCAKNGLEGFSLRPGVVYGPRSRWIADLARDLREGRAWLYQDGAAVLNGIYIDNLCHAVLQCLAAPATQAGTYIVGDPDEANWKDFTLAVAASIGVPETRVHRVTTLPRFERPLGQQLRDAATGSFAQTLLPLFPGALKRGVKRLLEPVAPPAQAWALPAAPAPRFTEELVLLQQCRWRLPHTRASVALGYHPTVSSREGWARSLAWLAFAEGRSC